MSIGNNNISFSQLKLAYANNDGTEASGHNALNDNKTNTAISLSYFRNALLADGSFIPSSGNSISLHSNFRNKTFAGKFFTTDDFNFDDDFSGENDRLYPVSSSTSTTNSNTGNIARLFHSNVTQSYPSILLCPQSGDPTIGSKDNAEVWIKIQLTSTTLSNNHFQIGIIHKQDKNSDNSLKNSWDWTNVAATALGGRHTTYNDRIALHTFGYVTHAGHDIESSSKIDELTGSTITNEPDSSNYHNRIGTTGGSGNGFTTITNTYHYLKNDVEFYKSNTHISSDYYIGMKVNYYEITLTGDVSNNSSTINNIQINGSQLTNSDHVYSGMYLSSTDTYFPASAIIQSITYSSSTSLVMGDEENGGNISTPYGYSGSTITFKAFGQRLEFKYTHDLFNEAKNIGPNHIILPRKYRESSSGSNLDIDSWAFFVGDSTAGANTGTFSIQNNNPTSFYSITYGFTNQIQQSTTGDWSPSSNTLMEDWVNGIAVVNGTHWTGTKSTKGWNLSNEVDSNSTPSASTGPGYGGYGNSVGFLYTEVSSSRHEYVFVCRTPAFNFSTLMKNTSNNLKLKFKVHGYGSQMGDLYVHISTNSKENDSSDQIGSYTSFTQTGYNSDWSSKTISLDNYRTVNSNHYIYFASYGASGYYADLAIDYVQICEEEGSVG
jgi:hypothetical protein